MEMAYIQFYDEDLGQTLISNCGTRCWGAPASIMMPKLGFERKEWNENKIRVEFNYPSVYLYT